MSNVIKTSDIKDPLLRQAKRHREAFMELRGVLAERNDEVARLKDEIERLNAEVLLLQEGSRD